MCKNEEVALTATLVDFILSEINVSNFAFNNKISIFELGIKQQSKLLNQYPNAIVLADDRILLSIPDYQIKSEIQRLQRLGVKILDIYPIEDQKYQKIMTEVEVISIPKEITPPSAPETEEILTQELISTPVITPELETQTNLESLRSDDSVVSPSLISETTIFSHTPWWVEIFTEFPRCLYYFGPFDSETEACSYQSGYQEDLEQENAKGIVVTIKQCSPQILTQEL